MCDRGQKKPKLRLSYSSTHWRNRLYFPLRHKGIGNRAACAPPPPPTECRRRAGVVFVTCSRHVVHQLYVARFLYSNAVYNEAWTLTKISKNDVGVFCNSPWYWNETRQRQSKSVSVDNFVKMTADTKSFVWNFLYNLIIKRMVQWKISTACSVITAYKVAKYALKAYKDIVSTKNLSQHFECLVKMRATSSTLYE